MNGTFNLKEDERNPAIIDGDGLVEERTDSGEKVPSLMDGLEENLDNEVLEKEDSFAWHEGIEERTTLKESTILVCSVHYY